MSVRQGDIVRLGVAAAFVLACVGCATRSEIKRFQQQLDYLTQSNASQERRLAEIDSLLRAQQYMLRQISATQQYNMEQLQREMQIVENILRESGFRVSELTEQIKRIQSEMASASTPQAEDTSDTASSVPASTVNPKQLYETASLDFNRGKFELARMEFAQFIELFPKSALADDAQYYLAECLNQLGKYEQAKREYLKVRSNYPESDLVPAALYNAGNVCLKLDDIDCAKRLFEEVVRSYPKSEEAALAKEKLARLGR